MSLRDPHLAFTALLAPVERFSTTPPPWPELITDLFGEVAVQPVDPVAAVLYGPVSRRRLAVTAGPGRSKALLVGLGDTVAVSVVAFAPGEVDTVPQAQLRETAVRGLLEGFPEDDEPEPRADLPAGEEALAEALRERLGADPCWEFLGVAEVLTVLVEGTPADLPVGGFWAEHGPLHIGRAVGVGEGHAAWEVQAHFTSASEMSVAEQRLRTLRDGYLLKVPPTMEYASAALRWGRAARRALVSASALDAIVDDVRAAASWAVAGGPIPAGGTEPPNLLQLAARLEMVRVGLVEEIETLKGLRPRLAGCVDRVFGDDPPAVGGPFAEGGGDGLRLLVALDAREASAARWSSALDVARRAQEAARG
jgi:hypothetical protein